MFTSTARQIASLGLAAIATLAILGSIDRLASEPAQQGLLAADSNVPTQVVVIQGKRIARS